jgi:hypothetical protein
MRSSDNDERKPVATMDVSSGNWAIVYSSPGFNGVAPPFTSVVNNTDCAEADDAVKPRRAARARERENLDVFFMIL